MWKSSALSHAIVNSNPLAKPIYAENMNDPDEWETDPDFVVSSTIDYVSKYPIEYYIL